MTEESVHEDIGYTAAAMSPVVPQDVQERLNDAMNMEPPSRLCTKAENKRMLREARVRLRSSSGQEAA